MEEETHGATPNDKEPKPETPAQGDNKNGSEPAETKPAAANNNNPAKGKKPRRTDVELYAALQEKSRKVAEKQREVKDRLDQKRDKELLKLKRVIGDCCLAYLKAVKNPEQAQKLVNMFHDLTLERDKSWVEENLDRLIKEHTKPKPNQDDANGDSPPPS